jgi:hypothetical protein
VSFSAIYDPDSGTRIALEQSQKSNTGDETIFVPIYPPLKPKTVIPPERSINAVAIPDAQDIQTVDYEQAEIEIDALLETYQRFNRFEYLLQRILAVVLPYTVNTSTPAPANTDTNLTSSSIQGYCESALTQANLNLDKKRQRVFAKSHTLSELTKLKTLANQARRQTTNPINEASFVQRFATAKAHTIAYANKTFSLSRFLSKTLNTLAANFQKIALLQRNKQLEEKEHDVSRREASATNILRESASEKDLSVTTAARCRELEDENKGLNHQLAQNKHAVETAAQAALASNRQKTEALQTTLSETQAALRALKQTQARDAATKQDEVSAAIERAVVKADQGAARGRAQLEATLFSSEQRCTELQKQNDQLKVTVAELMMQQTTAQAMRSPDGSISSSATGSPPPNARDTLSDDARVVTSDDITLLKSRANSMAVSLSETGGFLKKLTPQSKPYTPNHQVSLDQYVAKKLAAFLRTTLPLTINNTFNVLLSQITTDINDAIFPISLNSTKPNYKSKATYCILLLIATACIENACQSNVTHGSALLHLLKDHFSCARDPSKAIKDNHVELISKHGFSTDFLELSRTLQQLPTTFVAKEASKTPSRRLSRSNSRATSSPNGNPSTAGKQHHASTSAPDNTRSGVMSDERYPASTLGASSPAGFHGHRRGSGADNIPENLLTRFNADTPLAHQHHRGTH